MSTIEVRVFDFACGAGAAGGAKDYSFREHQMTTDTEKLKDAVLMEFLNEAMEIIRLNATARYGFKIGLESHSGGCWGSDSPSGVFISASFNGFIMTCRWNHCLGGDCYFKINWWIDMKRDAKNGLIGYRSQEFPIEDPRTTMYLENLTKRLADVDWSQLSSVDWKQLSEEGTLGLDEEDTR